MRAATFADKLHDTRRDQGVINVKRKSEPETVLTGIRTRGSLKPIRLATTIWQIHVFVSRYCGGWSKRPAIQHGGKTPVSPPPLCGNEGYRKVSLTFRMNAADAHIMVEGFIKTHGTAILCYGVAMPSAEQYRTSAQQCRKAAAKTDDRLERETLLRIASQWDRLAEHKARKQAELE